MKSLKLAIAGLLVGAVSCGGGLGHDSCPCFQHGHEEHEGPGGPVRPPGTEKSRRVLVRLAPEVAPGQCRASGTRDFVASGASNMKAAIQVQGAGADDDSLPGDDANYDELAAQVRSDMGADLLELRRLGGGSQFLAVLKPKPEALDKLKCLKHVAEAEDERVNRVMLDSSLPVIHADAAYDSGATGKGFAVAVLDTGVAVDHPFLKGRVKEELCFAKTCPTGPHLAAPLGHHGTHTAGVIAGVKVQLPGSYGASRILHGVAPGAEIIAVQVFDRIDDPVACLGAEACVVSYEASQIAALDYFARKLKKGELKDLAAINLSLGDGENEDRPCEDPRRRLVNFITRKGVAVVVAAGNSYPGQPGVAHPACIDKAIAVAATDDSKQVPTGLQNGAMTDLLAPGVLVTAGSRVVDGRAIYTEETGTSVAAAHVSGAIAALRSLPSHPQLEQVIDALRNTGEKVSDERFGSKTEKPLIDLNKAAETLRAGGRPPTTPVVSSTK